MARPYTPRVMPNTFPSLTPGPSLKAAIGDLQRAMREFTGYAPPPEADYMTEPQHPHDDPLYKAMEALNFYAHNSAGVIATDGGKIARDTLAELSGRLP